MQEELQVLEKYIRSKGLRNTTQRNNILEIFLKHEDHLSAEELYALVKKRYPEIGQATVFRTVKTFCEAGLATRIQDEAGVIKYEHAYKHTKHGHLVCRSCGRITEFNDPGLDELQTRIAKKNKFQADGITVKIAGLCRECGNKTKQP